MLTEKPTAFCEATTESEPGDYPITVSGGEAENFYTISGRRILKPQLCGSKFLIQNLACSLFIITFASGIEHFCFTD